MKPNEVKYLIANTQDGGSLEKSDRFNDFINECINCNTEGYIGNNTQKVNIEDLKDDFNYMIDQLKKALEGLNITEEDLDINDPDFDPTRTGKNF